MDVGVNGILEVNLWIDGFQAGAPIVSGLEAGGNGTTF